MTAESSQAKRNWFVTGCSAGLGRALTRAILAQGDNLIATARDPETIKDLDALAPGRVRRLALDVMSDASVEAAVKEGIAAFGGIDILVNNAGVGCVGAIEECHDEDILRVFGTNVLGTLRVTRAVLPHFREKRTGRIITLSSSSGVCPPFGHGMYGASKHALEGAFDILTQEVRPLGIKVTMMEPGLFKSDFRARNIGRAAHIIPDYADINGPVRASADSPYPDGTPEPEDFVPPIIGVANMADPPMRMPIGVAAWDQIRNRLKQRLQETDELWDAIQTDALLKPVN